MKTKILIFLFPLFTLSQVNTDILDEIKSIDSLVKKIDSIASNSVEETISNEFITLHGPTKKIRKRKQGRRYYVNTSELKVSNQTLRICNRKRIYDGDEDLHMYFSDSKLIYAELITWHERKKKFTEKKFYYENEKLIFPEYSLKNTIEEDSYIFEKLREFGIN